MKTWFNRDGGGKIKKGSNQKRGTLSDELSKADCIGRQLRCNESELNQLEEIENRPWKPQIVAAEHTIQYANKEDIQLPKLEPQAVEKEEAGHNEATFEIESAQSKLNLHAHIRISFNKEDVMALNMNIGSVIMILNSSGEQFDFKITNDEVGGQNLNISAPTSIFYQILALFE